MYTIFFLYAKHVFQQILVHEDRMDTKLVWVNSVGSQVPYGAMIAGYKSDDGPLYVAEIFNAQNRAFAGNYDPDKECAEYQVSSNNDAGIRCDDRWNILVVKYGTFNSSKSSDA